MSDGVGVPPVLVANLRNAGGREAGVFTPASLPAFGESWRDRQSSPPSRRSCNSLMMSGHRQGSAINGPPEVADRRPLPRDPRGSQGRWRLSTEWFRLQPPVRHPSSARRTEPSREGRRIQAESSPRAAASPTRGRQTVAGHIERAWTEPPHDFRRGVVQRDH